MVAPGVKITARARDKDLHMPVTNGGGCWVRGAKPEHDRPQSPRLLPRRCPFSAMSSATAIWSIGNEVRRTVETCRSGAG